MNFCKWVAIAMIIAGFVLALGTAGLSDNNAISFGEEVIRVLISVALAAIGAIAVYAIEKREVD